MALAAYDNLKILLLAVDRNDASDVSTAKYTQALLNAWSVLDHIHRLAMLIEEPIGVKGSSFYARKDFLTFGEQAKKLRNGVQHLHDQQIRSLVDNPNPVWGAIAWYVVDDWKTGNGSTHALVPGQLTEIAEPMLINPAGIRVVGAPAIITLSAYGHSICLSDAMNSLASAMNQLNSLLQEQGREFSTIPQYILVGAEFHASE